MFIHNIVYIYIYLYTIVFIHMFCPFYFLTSRFFVDIMSATKIKLCINFVQLFKGRFLLNIYIKKLKYFVGANHNGMNAYWSKMAADKGMIGLNFSNSSPLMAPTRSKKVSRNKIQP